MFEVTGIDAAILRYDCLPLLLQPLVENAIRHDLDCHQGSSHIHLKFSSEAGQLCISLCNSVTDSATKQEGFGMGLAHTRERLWLAYGKNASLNSAMHAGRFSVEIRQPIYGA